MNYEAVGKLLADRANKGTSKSQVHNNTGIVCWMCGKTKHGGSCLPQNFLDFVVHQQAIAKAFERVCPLEGWSHAYESELKQTYPNYCLKKLGNRKNCLRIEITKVRDD